MAASLDTLPRDVLQHIGLYVAVGSFGSGSLCQLNNLLLTCSSIYCTLRTPSCTQLYADIFRTFFDRQVTSPHLDVIPTDSSLCAELMQRLSSLRRLRSFNVNLDCLKQDIWTLLLMRFENVFLNTKLLGTVKCLEMDIGGNDYLAPEILWLKVLTLSLDDMARTEEAERMYSICQIQRFISFPLAESVETAPITAISSGMRTQSQRIFKTFQCIGSSQKADDPCTVICYGRQVPVVSLDASTAAILLIFAWRAATPSEIPPTLPETRAIALATRRGGPTKEDFLALQPSFPLCVGTSRLKSYSPPSFLMGPTACDGCLAASSHLGAPYLGQEIHLCHPGMLSGIWTGSFMTCSSSASPNVPSFFAEKPMQIAITERSCCIPLCLMPMDDRGRDLPPRHVKKGCLLEIHDAMFASALHQHSCNCKEASDDDDADESLFKYAVDWVINGQTLSDHERAWGGFTFAGRARRNGQVTFIRESKDADGEVKEKWMFQGTLVLQTALVGTWKSYSSDSIRGIFCLRRVEEHRIAGANM